MQIMDPVLSNFPSLMQQQCSLETGEEMFPYLKGASTSQNTLKMEWDKGNNPATNSIRRPLRNSIIKWQKALHSVQPFGQY